MYTIGQRRTVTAWWLFHNFTICNNPNNILELMEYAEQNIEDCDAVLAAKYEDYIPQI
jgi:hypothetical protein